MNYLAHLYFAKPTAASHFGNLLGDFQKGVNIQALPKPVQLGLQTHRQVDKFTDSHSITKSAKQLFSPTRRRFAGIALDVLYDHFLIKHWQQYHGTSLDDFKRQSFSLLHDNLHIMPAHMQRVISAMTQNDWFATYESVAGVGHALDNIAKRIRFQNQFAGSERDITKHYQQLESGFNVFFPQLIAHMQQQLIEPENLE
ncbi:ACP phosphodiesterase [Pseudoalteromonas piscicida]|uniref:acyl carrier protein phosphodiesterase n=1 Tax=Pseudoalteromonas piscicida TaxID=43662 RepID=UPI00273A4F34|nr:ACP phosphodiesterase [Pseudoalteromonas piscicida]MDP4487954.1 ACP phosphodiesterase [Pseudoalteromonas piscicida]